MKRYLKFNCTVCKRIVDKLVDNVRATPDKCDITFACEGRLLPVEYTSTPEITTNPEIGVLDWRPRNAAPISTLSSEVEFVNTSTGTFSQFIIGVVGTVASSLTLTLQQKSEAPKNYRQYVYRKDTEFDSVFGVESGLEKKTLRFTTADDVEVFINGIKIERVTVLDPLAELTFAVNDGSPNPEIAPNTIKFNKSVVLPGIVQLDVVVSPVVAPTLITVPLTRMISDESRAGNGSWENIDSVTALSLSSQPFLLFYCDLNSTTQIQTNTVLIPSKITIGSSSVEIGLENAIMLFAQSPFSQLDRKLSIVARLNSFSFERDYLKCILVDSKRTLQVAETAIDPIFPALKVQKFLAEPTVKTQIGGSESAITVPNSKVVGPQ